MKLLVIGASGLVGHKVAKKAMATGDDVIGTYNSREADLGFPCTKADVTDATGIHRLVSESAPDAVVNTSALHNVDYCEQHPTESDEVNAAAVGSLARACTEVGAKLVHLSTDYVFDGTKESPYSEDDKPAPLNAYGSSKLAGEKLVGDGHTVVRTSVVYGWTPTELAGIPSSSGKGINFALWLLQSLSSGKQVNIVTDQYATATLADSLADSLLKVAKSAESGTFHIAGVDCQSRYEFAAELAEVFGHDADLLSPTESAQFSQKANRPARSCLDSSKARRLLNMSHPHTKDALGIMRAQVEREAPELVGRC